jgi:uncharacterized protein YlxP (DUF503 family)
MSLFVGVVRIDLFLPQSRSLKDKRAVLHSIKDRLKPMNLAVAEVDGQDLWQRATLGVALVGAEPGHLEQRVQEVREVVEREYRALVSAFEWDVHPAPV